MGFLVVLWMVGAVAGLGQTSPPGTLVRVGPGVVQADGQTDARDAELEKDRKMLADWPQLGRYAEKNQALSPGEPGRVVFYGDSITDNWAKPGFAGAFFPGKGYVGRGISGQTTPQMLVRFRQDVIDLHPEAVVILAGINDIAGNTGPMTAKMTEDNLQSMAELAKANGVRVVMCSILPASDFPWRRGLAPAEKVKAINSWIKAYAAGAGLRYVDYWTAMADEAGGMRAGLSSDGVHPTLAGYAVMEPLAEAAIERK